MKTATENISRITNLNILDLILAIIILIPLMVVS